MTIRELGKDELGRFRDLPDVNGPGEEGDVYMRKILM